MEMSNSSNEVREVEVTSSDEIGSKLENPVVFLMGPTGVGKSKFSLLIAEEFKANIINSDAFSLYKHADHMTAKPSKEERSKYPHHMVDILEIDDITYTMTSYKKDAVKVLETLVDEGKFSLVVGGSNFYTNTLLFEENDGEIVSKDRVKSSIETIKESFPGVYQELLQIFDKASINGFDEEEYRMNTIQFFHKYQEIFYDILSFVDPESYKFLHRNDVKRIESALIYFFTNGYSKSLHKSNSEVKIRYRNSIVIVLLPKEIKDLNKRIESRIEEMVENGLYEIFYILSLFKDRLHCNKGVLQAIGYKEFIPLFEKIDEEDMKRLNDLLSGLNPSNNREQIIDLNKVLNAMLQEEKYSNTFKQCLLDLTLNTEKFARSQIKVLKNQFLSVIPKENLLLLELDFKDMKGYLDETKNFIENFIKNMNSGKGSSTSSQKVIQREKKMDSWSKFLCEKCGKEFNGENAYKVHLKSKIHKKKRKFVGTGATLLSQEVEGGLNPTGTIEIDTNDNYNCNDVFEEEDAAADFEREFK